MSGNLFDAIDAQDAQAAGVHDALKQCGSSVQQSAGGWAFVLSNGSTIAGTARIDDGWLVLDAPLSSRRRRRALRPQRLWRLLEWNGRLAGLAKFALLPRTGCLHLRAEIPLDDGADAPGARSAAACAAEVRRACDGWRAAAARYRRKRIDPAPPHLGDDAAATCELAVLCRQSGWAFDERGDGRLSVALDLADRSQRALLDRRPDGSLAAQAEILAAPALPPAARDALALLLITACGVVRMARAAVEETGDDGDRRTAARLEANLAPPASPAALSEALSALSVAAGLCGREARALQDERLAREYLAARRAWVGGAR